MPVRERRSAHPDTRRGWLQRGRGAGALALLEQAGQDAVDELIGCIVVDPRVDRQVEDRASYYAGLVSASNAPLGRIEERLQEVAGTDAPDESDAWLPLGVLAELARRGDARARDILRAETLGERLRELARLYLDEHRPLPPSSLVARGREMRASLEGQPTARLVEVALGPPCSERRTALRLLGARDHAALVPEAVARLEAKGHPADPTAFPAFLGYLEALPGARVLPLARNWLDTAGPLAQAAEILLARHAEEADRARVHAKAEAALGAGEEGIYTLCSMLDALARVPHAAELPLLSAIVVQTSYSYARTRAIRAIAAFPAEPTAAALLREALWDCEPGTREIACRATQANWPGVTQRLGELASDPFEQESVRRAACGRGD